MSSQRPRMFYGWLVIGCTLLAMALSSGTDRSFGVVVIPLVGAIRLVTGDPVDRGPCYRRRQ